jgi:CheY-like chemotaxis protein
VKSAANAAYDVIRMDAALPMLDGLEATRRIRALPGAAAQTPVIGISGRTEGGEAAARAAGMNAYFTKPVSPGKLAEVLSRIA